VLLRGRLRRILVAQGACQPRHREHVLDAASLPIDRRAKHIKTDNIGAKRLLRAIVDFVQGGPQSCRLVRAPTPEEEDARRLHRERQRLVREVGLTPAPYDSGDTKHDQGINKAGNTRARVIAVQMAWLWLRYQSKSELSLWYYSRVGNLKGRVRRIMIIALARKLVIALWRYVETGKVPTGAIVTT
jgi:transposase